MRVVALGLVLALAGCAHEHAPPPAPAATPPPPPVPTLWETQREIGAYIDSGRYEADVARVAGDALAWLETRAPQAAKPAIVLDIDETSLSNWPAYRLNQWARIVDGPCDLEHGPCGLRTWQAMARSAALAPTLHLAERARALGVAVFFVTGRPPALRAATERNLRAQGYRWTDVILLPKDGRFASAAAFKSDARRRIAEQGYTILLTMGDQQSDLDGGFAERTFKLPNPVYLLP
jgi:predicted secreted acid phosphatase